MPFREVTIALLDLWWDTGRVTRFLMGALDAEEARYQTRRTLHRVEN